MCQIVPFSLPCCRRTYVAISKVPSCPDNWPKSKCPPELCIQICYEPDERETGVCWRCRADRAGVPDELRETLRPGIDNADVVVGLEELNADDRRKIAERGGHCWFCGSRNGCGTCGTNTKAKTAGHQSPVKRQRLSTSGRAVNKRLKIQGIGMRPRVSRQYVQRQEYPQEQL